MHLRLTTLALASAALTAAPSAGRAQTVIDFAGNACDVTRDRKAFNEYPSPFDTQGFRFTAVQAGTELATPCNTGHNPAFTDLYTDATTLFANNPGNTASGPVALTQIGGNPFSISRIDLAQLLELHGPDSATFTGTLVGGGTVTQTFLIPGYDITGVPHPTLTTFNFLPAFTNLTSLEFSEEFVNANDLGLSNTYQWTNLYLTTGAAGGPSVVPEPSTWALLGAGLVGLGGVTARRRRSATA